MPKVENFLTHIKIDSQPFSKNRLTYRPSADGIALYYLDFPDQIIASGRFSAWTDLNDIPFVSLADLTSDLDIFLYGTAGSENYFLNISQGLVEGHSLFGVIAIDATIGTTEKVIGGMPGRYPFQTSAVALEVLSDSILDTSAGTGARTIIVRGLDSVYGLLNTSGIVLNGTTPVAITGSFLRVNQSEVITAGSTGENQGTITIRVVSTGDVLSVIKPNTNISRDGAATVPAARTAFLWTAVTLTDKGNDALVKIYRRPFEELFILRASLPTYQNEFERTFKIPPRIAEKTDMEFTAISENPATSAIAVQEFELVQNEFLTSETIQVMNI